MSIAWAIKAAGESAFDEHLTCGLCTQMLCIHHSVLQHVEVIGWHGIRHLVNFLLLGMREVY